MFLENRWISVIFLRNWGESWKVDPVQLYRHYILWTYCKQDLCILIEYSYKTVLNFRKDWIKLDIDGIVEEKSIFNTLHRIRKFLDSRLLSNLGLFKNGWLFFSHPLLFLFSIRSHSEKEEHLSLLIIYIFRSGRRMPKSTCYWKHSVWQVRKLKGNTKPNVKYDSLHGLN